MTTKNSFDENESRKRIIYLIDTYCDGKQQIFADKCGIGKSSVSQYVNGTNTPGNIHASKIANAFDVNIMWVMGFDTTMRVTPSTRNEKISYVPIYGRVSAGQGIVAYEEIEDYVILDQYKNAEEYFALRIRGDSMNPRIHDGDVVIVRKQDYANDNDVVVAITDDDVAVCKRFKHYPDSIALLSDNPAYHPIIFTKTNDQVHILGKVIELRGAP